MPDPKKTKPPRAASQGPQSKNQTDDQIVAQSTAGGKTLLELAAEFQIELNPLNSALRYAAGGWPILPLLDHGKTPRTKHGLRDATSDPVQIRRWWKRWPQANVGLLAPAGVLILDLDVKDGKDGIAEINSHAPKGERLDPTTWIGPWASTPSGGAHVVMCWPDGVPPPTTSAGRFPGVDLRGLGRAYVVVSPSSTTDGSYRWINPLVPVADLPPCPQWIVDLLKPAPPTTRQTKARTAAPPDRDLGSYFNGAVASATNRVHSAGEGERNSTLNAESFGMGQLHAAGLDRSVAEGELVNAALGAGLTETEARKTFDSGWRAGEQSPRAIPDLNHNRTRARAQGHAAEPPPHDDADAPAAPHHDGGELPMVVINRQPSAVRRNAWEALRRANEPPTLFERGTVATQLVPAGARAVTPDTLRGLLEDAARWVRESRTEEDTRRTPAAVPRPLPVVRAMVGGATPLHVLEATTRGTGKGLLAAVIAVIGTGEDPAPTKLPSSEEERRKKITALLSSGASLILLDNETGVLRSATLDAVLTAAVWSDRILGVTVMARCPNLALWILTSNNAQLGGDLARRSIRCRMDAGVEQPWLRDGLRHPNLVQWTRDHRAKLCAALLTMARHWNAIGRPEHTGRSLGSFEPWARTIGGILDAAGIPGFLENLAEWYGEGDSDAAEWRVLVTAWTERYGSAFVTASDLVTLADDCEIFGELLGGEAQRRDGAPNRSAVSRMGRALDKKRDATIAGYRIVKTQSRKRTFYQVIEARRAVRTWGADVVDLGADVADLGADVADVARTWRTWRGRGGTNVRAVFLL